MRICLVTTEYPPGPMGGVGTYSIILPQLLVEAGHEVTILTKQFNDGAPYEREGGIEVHRLPTYHPYSEEKGLGDNELFCLEMQHLRSFVGIFAREVERKLIELHQQKPFDVVLSQDVEAPCWLIQDRRLLFNELGEVPFVIFIHSPHWQIQYHNEDSQYDRHEYHRFLYEKMSMSMADGLISASRHMHHEALEHLGLDESRMRIIPLPLGAIPPVADFEQRIGSDDSGEKRIVYSGRIELRKGVETLLKAVVPLLEEDPELTLHLIGRDTDHPTLGGKCGETLSRRLLPERLRERVIFRGFLPREELWAEYSKATLGVVPSPWEPFSFVCQEMMACGTPLVATQTGGMADMIEDGVSGLLCTPADTAELEAALRHALTASPSQRAQWGYAAAGRIRAFCDNRQIVGDTIAFLTEVVERNRVSQSELKRVPIPGNLPYGDRPAARKAVSAAGSFPQLKKVGVVVPCYNLGAFLPECLDSIARQTFKEIEVYIVDDESNQPETLVALEEAAQRPGVTVLSYKNGGLPASRNRGAKVAIENGCDTLVFLDADDWIEDSFIAKALEVLNRHSEVGAVTAWTHTIGMMHTYWAPPHPQFPFLLAECMSTPPGVVRSSAYVDVGGVSELFKYSYEDWDFWISLCEAGYAILTIPEPLIVYRMRKGSMSRMFNPKTREHGRLRLMQRHGKLYSRYATDLLLLEEGMRYKQEQRYNDELYPLRDEIERARVDMEWNIKEWKHWKALWEEENAQVRQLQEELESLKQART